MGGEQKVYQLYPHRYKRHPPRGEYQRPLAGETSIQQHEIQGFEYQFEAGLIKSPLLVCRRNHPYSSVIEHDALPVFYEGIN